MSKKSIIRDLLSKGYTQMEVAQELGIPQSSVSYYSSNYTMNAARNREYCRYRLKRCVMVNERIIVYKEFGTLYMTSESNYNAVIRDANKVSNLANFENFDEVVSYMKKYGKTEGVEFVDRTEVK